ncbi:uncharacterized protein AC631_01122 [Debaryomyces fabryi]|uniref:Uncharacterized protein n=1 Tax=Debaryomyces fabryi TaxID=58627 RepID=A0A0V1Q4C2_9ASCO|nr:uncharacterized protein AC631_01122 [Debaryomyces fabryi]KSA03109.1 hypothetical protein AC631_01122 [Debaryomyces fabryi]CUM45987.1 unnamed protein product [Debaryomyces fabryi]
MSIFKTFDYFVLKLLNRIEKFIRNLNAKLLRESTIKRIGNDENVEITLLDCVTHTKENIKEGYLLDANFPTTIDNEIHGSIFYTEYVVNAFESSFEKNLGDNEYYDLRILGYSNPTRNTLTVLSLVMLLVILGSVIYFITEYLIARKSCAAKIGYNTWNMSLESKDQVQNECIYVSDLINTYSSTLNYQANTKFHAYVEANAQIPSLGKQDSDILQNNLNFISYDFIIDEYMDNMDEMNAKYTISGSIDKKFIQYPIIKPKLKEVQSTPKQPRLHHAELSSEELYSNNKARFEYIRPHLESSSMLSEDPSPPQTLKSDIQNNSIITDDEFERSQQNCLQNLLHLYNETHVGTIPCFPITVQAKYNKDGAFHEVHEITHKYSSKEGTSQVTSDSEFSESEYIATYEKGGYDKRNIKPFAKLSRTKYSPLYSAPKFELSRTTIPLVSNKEHNPSIFFDLYHYLGFLDIDDRLKSLDILSHEYNNDHQLVIQLIELEILNLCSTSNEFEMQDTVKKLQYIITREYDGDNPNISKIIEIYSNSLKRHIHELTALLKTPFAEIIVVLLCDYLSFAEDNKIDIETYNHCLGTIIESTVYNKEFYRSISNSACIVVCALDCTMLPHTLFVIFDHIFMEEKHKQPEKQITALRCLKYYICFNKLSIIEELTTNPMENKFNCCGYQLINLLLSSIPKIIRISSKSSIPYKLIPNQKHRNLPSSNENIDPLILELIDTYLAIVEIFLNNDKIPSAIQYELLSSFITKIYTQIKPIVECDRRTLDPPILKELQIHFDLNQ